jgi:phage shock protein PspC (stress-responsive transcriptional regulator)
MIMESADFSSQDKLDQMLRDGKVTAEDYLRLSKAMRKKPASRDEEASQPKERRKLHKSWKNRQLGGVCWGIAEYFRIDPIIVRIIAVVLACVAPPIVLAAYVVLYLMVPWDDPEPAKSLPYQGHPWRFLLFGTLTATILPWALSQFLLPRIENVFSQLSVRLPTMAQFAIRFAEGYRFNDSDAIPRGISVSLLFVAIGFLIQMICKDRKLRLIYSVIFFVFASSLTLFAVIEIYSVLFSLPKIVGN